MDKRLMQQSQHFEGNPKPDWELIGMKDNGMCYIRYYRDRQGKCWHNSQKKKRKEPYGKLVIREDESGRTFAQRVYPKRKAKHKMA